MVALSNPLDYHTYVWRDVARMTAAWLPMAADHIGLTLFIVDYPHTDASDWDCATQAALAVRAQSGRPVAVVATLPELMPADVAERADGGRCRADERAARGDRSGSRCRNARRPEAAAAVAAGRGPSRRPCRRGCRESMHWRRRGCVVPKGAQVGGRRRLAAAVAALDGPLVLKVTGLAHKSEVGGVRLGLRADEVQATARQMPQGSFLRRGDGAGRGGGVADRGAARSGTWLRADAGGGGCADRIVARYDIPAGAVGA